MLKHIVWTLACIYIFYHLRAAKSKIPNIHPSLALIDLKSSEMYNDNVPPRMNHTSDLEYEIVDPHKYKTHKGVDLSRT